jgi:hypothetical protein
MSRRVTDLLVETLQAAGVKNCYGIVGDTLNRIAHANDRGERGAPRRMRRSESEGGQPVAEDRWRYRIIAQTNRTVSMSSGPARSPFAADRPQLQSFRPRRSEAILSSRRFLLAVGAPALPPQIAVDAEFANRCVDLAAVRAATTGQNSKLIELTSDQWQFLRGIYAMNPEAPPGLPYGDKAVFTLGGDSNGLLFFVEGDKACAPTNAPPALLSLMDQVAVGDASHQGAGLCVLCATPWPKVPKPPNQCTLEQEPRERRLQKTTGNSR